MQDLSFRDKRVTVVGLGIEGEDMVRYLARQGAYVTVSDSKPRQRLAERIERLADLPVKFSLGKNDAAVIADTDAVFVSQSVPLDLPGVARAQRQGVPIWSMLSLFMELCPGPIVGITGSSGKTTTTALVGEMFRREGVSHVIGGNIGIGLLDLLPSIRPYTWVVLEISHTQLQLARRSPHVAAVLNVTPNHLDHFSWDEYRDLKRNLIRFQGAGDAAILGQDDTEARSFTNIGSGSKLFFSLESNLRGDGVCVENGNAVLKQGRRSEPLFPMKSLRLRGRHNQANAIAAAAVASACGISTWAIRESVAEFRGVPHRLELVGTIAGVEYYNDSIATTPERTLAGMRSFERPLVLLLGGQDKHLPLEELAREAHERCRAVITFGEAGLLLADAIEAAGGRARLIREGNLEAAMAAAMRLAQPGDVVLLSPACTSFDAYDNFEQRGQHFRDIVRARAGEAEPSLR
ncbi:MAG TPA: UDP-N-acetylmuramoyl-L-alanine--D-glutamate ligase [Dehalococcoidia bacterium]|nr:UDP-N-acetylmuramoyl-L-alanine--D-glutamate ligase [Dehalococcoidia bacterium]